MYELNQSQYLWALEKMILIRRFEEKCAQLYNQRMIRGFCHLSIGQEAIVVATALAKDPKDSTITSYRCHGHALIFGQEPKNILSELLGKQTGCSKGKGGSMHLFSLEGNFYGGHGIVGAQIPIGTGIAFAEKYYGTNNICYVFFGDGAANQGQTFEAFNMAALWNLPVLYIIENNQYAMGTSVERSTAVTDLYTRGQSLGIKGIQVDGMDLERLYSEIIQATMDIRMGKGPVIIEAKTYRYKGHSMSDPGKYRSKEEVQKYKELDPIEFIKESILKKSYATKARLDEIDEKIKKDIEEASNFAHQAPLPEPCELLEDVYCQKK